VNKAELVSHVAAETPTTRAAAERMVGAVFSAIADALARDEPVAIAGFGKFTVRGRARHFPPTGCPLARTQGLRIGCFLGVSGEVVRFS